MDDAGVQNVGLLKPTRNANLNQNASDARASRGVEREEDLKGGGCWRWLLLHCDTRVLGQFPFPQGVRYD
jgi:hypothetical protein